MADADGDDARPTSNASAPATAAQRHEKRPRLSRKRRECCDLDARGVAPAAIVEQVGCHRATFFRWRREPAYLERRARLRAELAAEGEVAIVAARPHAIRTLAAAAEKGDVESARAILQASMPPGEGARRRATAQLLARLSPSTRAAVLAELEGDERASLEAMGVAELDALVGGGAP